MANHYRDVIIKLNQRFPDKDKIIIDFSEIYDKNKVSNGSKLFAYVSQKLYLFNENTNLINIFMNGGENNLYIN
jgi:hypothetical protein